MNGKSKRKEEWRRFLTATGVAVFAFIALSLLLKEIGFPIIRVLVDCWPVLILVYLTIGSVFALDSD